MLKRVAASWKGFIKYLPLLKELVVRDIKVKYKRSVLGLLWTVLNPLMMMGVMTIVFSKLFHNTIDNFAVYYLTGYIFYTFLSESTTQALFSVVFNAPLMKKVYIPKYLFPISKVMSSLVNLGFSFVAMLIVMFVTSAKVYWTILLAPVAALYLLIFCCGFGMVLATSYVFFRDTGHLYGIVTLLWMYLTPLFYPIELLKENGMKIIMDLNPLYHYITYFRMLVLEGQIPGLRENIVCVIPSIVMVVIGAAVFYKNQDRFILHV